MSKTKKAPVSKEQPEFIDDRALEARTGIKRSTWQAWRASGEGPAFYRFGWRCLYKWSEVETWAKSFGGGK